MNRKEKTVANPVHTARSFQLKVPEYRKRSIRASITRDAATDMTMSSRKTILVLMYLDMNLNTYLLRGLSKFMIESEVF